MRRPTIALFVGLAALLVLPVPTLAARPERDPVVADNFTISGSCAFDVDVEILANKEVFTTFSNGRLIITGRLVLRVANAEKPENSIVLHVSGPSFVDPQNPSVFVGSGTGLAFLEDVLLLSRGPAIFTTDEAGNTTLDTTSASAIDLCPLLA